MSTHYIAMAGLRGYMPHCCEAFSQVAFAAAYLAEIHELNKEQTVELKQERFLNLDIHQYGNEYCQIKECNCDNPVLHCESGYYD